MQRYATSVAGQTCSNSVATAVSLVNIRLLLFPTSDFYVTFSYKLNASITNTKQSAMNFAGLPSCLHQKSQIAVMRHMHMKHA